MKTLLSLFVAFFIGISGACSTAAAATTVGNAVEVSIVSDDGRYLPFYTVRSRDALKKVYAEAVKGELYRIVVRNKLNRRIGVVIAVDGRNIISGQKSWLANTERMYILDPYVTNEYSGWRTGQDRVNRFYFTDVPDSYAAAFGDESAMGVIAVAVYPEMRHHWWPPSHPSFWRHGKSGQSDAESKAAPSSRMEAFESAGTGYGSEEYSPSRRVDFDSEKIVRESIFIKYEWRDTLCRLKVIDCGPTCGHSHNRLWDNDDYAPPPPRWR